MSIRTIRHAEPSVLLSLDDEPWQPSRRLLELSAQLAAITPGINHPMLPFRRNPIIVFDDIRLMRIVYVWRSIQRPKMDMTSFGHWSGGAAQAW